MKGKPKRKVNFKGIKVLGMSSVSLSHRLICWLFYFPFPRGPFNYAEKSHQTQLKKGRTIRSKQTLQQKAPPGLFLQQSLSELQEFLLHFQLNPDQIFPNNPKNSANPQAGLLGESHRLWICCCWGVKFIHAGLNKEVATWNKPHLERK